VLMLEQYSTPAAEAWFTMARKRVRTRAGRADQRWRNPMALEGAEARTLPASWQREDGRSLSQAMEDEWNAKLNGETSH
jgi:hypothetical protein